MASPVESTGTVYLKNYMDQSAWCTAKLYAHSAPCSSRWNLSTLTDGASGPVNAYHEHPKSNQEHHRSTQQHRRSTPGASKSTAPAEGYLRSSPRAHSRGTREHPRSAWEHLRNTQEHPKSTAGALRSTLGTPQDHP